jgi:hypothetical protein
MDDEPQSGPIRKSRWLMNSLSRSSLLLMTIVGTTMTVAKDTPVQPPVERNPKAVAPKTEIELAEIVLKALEAEDYDTIEKLMVPFEMAGRFGLKKNRFDDYKEYLKQVRPMSRRFRKYLQQKGILPAVKPTFFAFEPRPVLDSDPNSPLLCDCVIVTVKDRKAGLIEGLGYADGRWYILMLVAPDHLNDLPPDPKPDPPADKKQAERSPQAK